MVKISFVRSVGSEELELIKYSKFRTVYATRSWEMSREFQISLNYVSRVILGERYGDTPY